MKIGLYFGSFNPIHIGHLIVANTMIEKIEFDQVWMVISPQNPFKRSSGLANEQDRKFMTELAVANHAAIVASDVEFHLPKPSYTIETLHVLFEKHPSHTFSLIMGKDNLIHFNKWKNYEAILECVDIQVYDRKINAKIPPELADHPKIFIHQFPLINVSSTMIRNKAANGESIKYWVPNEVEHYILENDIFRNT